MNEDFSLLRVIVDDYDAAQRTRIAKGEQIRAIAQGRDQQDPGYLASLGFVDEEVDGEVVKSAADFLLEAILRNETDEPSPYLAWAFRQQHASERMAFSKMDENLEPHPAWGWMSAIRGVGPTLGAKLLSRLDITKAHNASSFWSYCGLTTVPGQEWHCEKCGWVAIFPEGYNVTGTHKACKQLAVKRRGFVDGIRAAQPKAEKGQKRDYDAFAKKTLYLLASSWLKAGSKSFYAGIYREKISFYERERPGWEKGRKHYSALRAAEKLFLSHLYEAWCLAIGQEPVPSYAQAALGHHGIVSAAEVLAWEAAAKVKTAA